MNRYMYFLNNPSTLVAQTVKRLPAMQETQVRSLGLEDPWRRKWQPTPIFLPEESHGQRSLVGYSPRGSQRVGHDWATSNKKKSCIGRRILHHWSTRGSSMHGTQFQSLVWEDSTFPSQNQAPGATTTETKVKSMLTASRESLHVATKTQPSQK